MLEPTGATGGAHRALGSLRGKGEEEEEAMALKKAAEQAAGAGSSSSKSEERQFFVLSRGLSGSQCAKPKPGQAEQLFSFVEKQGTRSMGWVWLRLPGGGAGRAMDSPGPAQFFGTQAGEREG